VKVRGVRVDILEVEQALSQHDLVHECAVAAWPHPQRPQDMLLVAYIVVRPEMQQPPGQPEQQQADMDSPTWQQQLLQQHAASVLPPAAWPAAYLALTCLPRSPAGKVLRSQLPQPASTIAQQQLQLLLQGPQLSPQLLHSQAVQQLQEQPGQHSEVAVMWAMLAAVPYGPGARASKPAQPLPGLDATAPTAAAMQRDLTASAGAALSVDDTAAAASTGSSIACQQQPCEPTQNFFTAWGGDSLAAAAVAAALGVDVRLVYAYPTARSLSAFLRHHPAGAGSAAAAAAGHAAGADIGDAWPHMASADAQSKQAAMAGMRPSAAEPSPKRPRLLPGAEAPLQQDDPKHCTFSVAALISQAAVAVVIGAASRLLAWKLPDSSCASRAPNSTPAAAAAAAAPSAGRQVSSSPPPPAAAAGGATEAPGSAGHPSHSQQQPEELKLHWRIPMGRCVDAAPLLLALTRPVLPGSSLVSPASSQGASAASSGAVAAVKEAAAPYTATRSSCGEAVAAAPAPPAAAGLRVQAAGWEVVGLLAFACSHSGLVKCMEVHTGKPHAPCP